MRLKNKKTGEIVVANVTRMVSGVEFDCGQTLAELSAEWRDYEEPKDFWYIDDFMIMCGTEGEFTNIEMASFTKKDIEKLKAIGNYFETKEEAEKAVEKLKAWKRLKDKGFRFYGYQCTHSEGEELCGDAYFKTGKFWSTIKQDIDLLFGGEE